MPSAYPRLQEQIVDIREVTREGLTLTVAVLPASLSYPEEKVHEAARDDARPGDDNESSSADTVVDVRSDIAEDAGSDKADARSIAYSATIRRRYLENELRRTQEQIVDIDSFTMRGSPTTSRMSLATVLGSPVGESNQEMAELLKAARERNAMLMSRIDALESHMQSAWAQGLSDESPPGYTVTP